MSMMMNAYERRVFSKLQATMSRRDAEEEIRWMRVEQNGDEYTHLLPPESRYVHAYTAERAEAQQTKTVSKVVPKAYNLPDGLTKRQRQAKVLELAKQYGLSPDIIRCFGINKEPYYAELAEALKRSMDIETRDHLVHGKLKYRRLALVEHIGEELAEKLDIDNVNGSLLAAVCTEAAVFK